MGIFNTMSNIKRNFKSLSNLRSQKYIELRENQKDKDN